MASTPIAVASAATAAAAAAAAGSSEQAALGSAEAVVAMSVAFKDLEKERLVPGTVASEAEAAAAAAMAAVAAAEGEQFLGAGELGPAGTPGNASIGTSTTTTAQETLPLVAGGGAMVAPDAEGAPARETEMVFF